jgi:hypothetical protein
LRMGRGIDFGIESLNREGKAHRANQLPAITLAFDRQFPES